MLHPFIHPSYLFPAVYSVIYVFKQVSIRITDKLNKIMLFSNLPLENVIKTITDFIIYVCSL